LTVLQARAKHKPYCNTAVKLGSELSSLSHKHLKCSSDRGQMLFITGCSLPAAGGGLAPSLPSQQGRQGTKANCWFP